MKILSRQVIQPFIVLAIGISVFIIGCNDNSSGPVDPVLTSFSIQEYHLSNSTYTPIDTQVVGQMFNLAITARDQNNDTMKTYTDSVVITVSGLASFIPDTTSAFEDGWTSELIVISDTGKFTITAHQIGGSHFGISNQFYVRPATGGITSTIYSQPTGKR